MSLWLKATLAIVLAAGISEAQSVDKKLVIVEPYKDQLSLRNILGLIFCVLGLVLVVRD